MEHEAAVATLDAAGLRDAILAFAEALRACKSVLNRLNVYPVPDGDTGTNMTGTVEQVVAELAPFADVAPGNLSMADVCKAIAHGSLMGARGNSGIILCQVLRGFVEVARNHEVLDAATVAAGLALASEQADGAVAKPIEGTILSVVRAAKMASADAVAADAAVTLVDLLAASRFAAVAAVAHTPEQLAVLKQAGVVDAGAAGFCLFLDGLLHVVAGVPLPDIPPVPQFALDSVADGRSPGDALMGDVGEAPSGPDGEKHVSELRYEVMYLLEAPDTTIPAFKEVWSTIGDSIVVVGGDGLWNCHIHCDDVGAAVEAALDAGRPRRIKVTDLLDQVEEERWVREADPSIAGPASDDDLSAVRVPCAVVAVCVGDGVRRIFKSLKVSRVVTGGQTMNPSTADLLAAVEAAPSDEVVLLPNNKNIIPVARAVNELTAKTVRVVPTIGVAEGFAALLDYDPEASADTNAARMSEAAERIVSGEVTRSVRSTASSAGPIVEGDWIGIGPAGITTVAKDLDGAVTALLAALLTDDHEIVTLIEGEGSGAAETRRLTEWMAEHRSDVAVEVLHGGQPLYPYLLSIE